MNIDWPTIVTPLVGKPFQWGAKGPDTYDCWGLARRVLILAGLPAPVDDWARQGHQEAVAILEGEIAGGKWVKAEVPEVGDVVAMSTHRLIHHVGVLTPYGILHTSEKRGAIVSSEASLRAAMYRRIEYYRWAP